jgi:hypothetical protein
MKHDVERGYDEPATTVEKKPLNAQSVGRAVAARAVRAVRRGNLPFLIVFVT